MRTPLIRLAAFGCCISMLVPAFAGNLAMTDFEPDARGQQAQATTGGADGPRISWIGGAIQAVDHVELRASGKHALVGSPVLATAVFSEPVMNVEFFYVHGHGIGKGTATAYGRDGRVIGSVKSRPATTFGDLRNFVQFKTREPISMIEFDGGAVDAFSASAFEIDYPLVRGQWVEDLDTGQGNSQGITFDFISTSNLLFAAWFTYIEDPIEPTFEEIGALDNRWLTAQLDIGAEDPNVASGPVFASSGGAFQQPSTGFQETVQVGSMTVEFLDCDLARVSYQIDTAGRSGQFQIIPIEKNVNPNGFSCDPEASRPMVFEPDISRTDGNINMLVRAARDQNRIAMQFQWRSNKNYPGILHDLRSLDESGSWSAPVSNISRDSVTRVNEDRIALIFQAETDDRILSDRTRNFGCFMACHEDMDRMPKATGDATHYIINPLVAPGTYQADMWHWRGARSGPMGFAEDTWVSAELLEDPDSQGRQRDANSIGPNGERWRLRENQSFSNEVEVVIDGQQRMIQLPDLVYNPALNSGFYFLNDGSRLITEDRIGDLWAFNTIESMEAGELQHALIPIGPRANALFVADLDQDALNEVARQALAGGVVTRVRLNDDFTGDSDQHDVRSMRSFESGFWTVTMVRELSTGSAADIDLSTIEQRNYSFGVAVHDSNNGGRSHQVSVPLRVGLDGDIVPAVVDKVEDVDWLSLPAFSTVLFKPGDMSFEWLQDKTNGHRIPIETRCSTCHGQGGVASRAPINLQD
ncbi:MAG: ethylbenzene dehydrogenase-related protein [Xanthomonadales bacterium]|nr:ethylbenzene dehydrogenase-related protein [Xanthomonadales bacterium]